MTLAVIFNGQGAHYEGMAMDFVQQDEKSAAVFELAQAVTTWDVAGLINEKIESLSQTRYAQLATATASLAIFQAIKDQLPAVSYMAGLSLGEYTALIAADYVSMEEGFSLIQDRGNLMSDYCQELKQEEDLAMAAVLKASAEEVEGLIAEVQAEGLEAYVANYNSSTQTVIAGRSKALDCFKTLGVDQGIKKILPLDVEGPFHTPFMEGLRPSFEARLSSVTFNKGTCPVISNTTVQLHQVDQLKENLSRHLTEPVRWSASIEKMKQAGVDRILQIGPGKTLVNLLKREKDVPPFYVVDQLEDVEGLNDFLHSD